MAWACSVLVVSLGCVQHSPRAGLYRNTCTRRGRADLTRDSRRRTATVPVADRAPSIGSPPVRIGYAARHSAPWQPLRHGLKTSRQTEISRYDRPRSGPHRAAQRAICGPPDRSTAPTDHDAGSRGHSTAAADDRIAPVDHVRCRDGAGLFRSALHALVTPDTAWVFIAPSAMAPFLLFMPLSRQHGAGGR